ncbi:hypothetical protein ZHAS_00015564 [Anopheles sinensis]|uniref:Uncharacterized protein n=1 Tax=Anopheles sinensis TaxID=74873 RepID=A0A084WBK1_ANOSI|nr:hypothetical protein ZHAS_00015564 [Anopheles sinensis]
MTIIFHPLLNANSVVHRTRAKVAMCGRERTPRGSDDEPPSMEVHINIDRLKPKVVEIKPIIPSFGKRSADRSHGPIEIHLTVKYNEYDNFHTIVPP